MSVEDNDQSSRLLAVATAFDYLTVTVYVQDSVDNSFVLHWQPDICVLIFLDELGTGSVLRQPLSAFF